MCQCSLVQTLMLTYSTNVAIVPPGLELRPDFWIFATGNGCVFWDDEKKTFVAKTCDQAKQNYVNSEEFIKLLCRIPNVVIMGPGDEEVWPVIV